VGDIDSIDIIGSTSQDNPDLIGLDDQGSFWGNLFKF